MVNCSRLEHKYTKYQANLKRNTVYMSCTNYDTPDKASNTDIFIYPNFSCNSECQHNAVCSTKCLYHGVNGKALKDRK